MRYSAADTRYIKTIKLPIVILSSLLTINGTIVHELSDEDGWDEPLQQPGFRAAVAITEIAQAQSYFNRNAVKKYNFVFISSLVDRYIGILQPAELT